MDVNRENHWEFILQEVMKATIFDMTHPGQRCIGAMEYNDFLDRLQSDFQPHIHWIPHGDLDTD